MYGCAQVPGTGQVFAVFYAFRFTLNEAVGRNVTHVHAGELPGGYSGFAHIEQNGEDIDMVFRSVRLNPDPASAACAGPRSSN